MTKQEISVLLGILYTAYPRFYVDITSEERDDAIALWQAMLSDIDLKTAKLALHKLIATCKFPPTIAEMRECVTAVKYLPVADAGAAWAEVNMAIRLYGFYRQDEALASMSELTRQTTIRMGWKEMCMSETEHEMADRAHFFRIYDSLAKRVEQDRLLPDMLRAKINVLTQELTMDTVNKPLLTIVHTEQAESA